MGGALGSLSRHVIVFAVVVYDFPILTACRLFFPGPRSHFWDKLSCPGYSLGISCPCMAIASNVAEDDDPIVAEYPVLISHQLADSVHLFQFPLRPKNRPYEASKVTITAAAPSSSKGSHSSRPAFFPQGSRFVMNIDLDATGSPAFPSLSATHQPTDEFTPQCDAQRTYRYSLESQPATLSGNYVAALFANDEVHLTPISSLQSFMPRPYDTPTTDEKTEDIYSSKLDLDPSTSSAMRQHLEKQLRRFRSVMLAQDNDQAKTFELLPSAAVESQTVAQRLVCAAVAGGPPSQSLSDLSDQMAVFFPWQPTSDESFREVRPMLIRYAKDHHSVESQVYQILTSAKVISLSQLSEYISWPAVRQGVTLPSPLQLQQMLIGYLRRHACLIHGSWAINYDATFRSSAAVIREFVLLKMATSPGTGVTRSQLMVHLPNDTASQDSLTAILETIATKSGATGEWQIKHFSSQNVAILKANFSNDCTAAEINWEKASKDIASNMELLRSGKIVPRKNLRLLQSASTVQTRVATTAPLSAETPALATARRYFKNTLQQYGVLNREVLKERISVLLRTPGSALTNSSKEAVFQAAQEMLVVFTPATWILKSVDPATDRLRRALVLAMRRKSSFQAKEIASDALSILREEDAKRGGGALTAETIPQSVVHAVVAELSEYHGGEKLWHVKTGLVDWTGTS